MRKPNAYNQRSGVLLQGTSEYHFTYDEAEEQQDMDFVMVSPTNDFTNIINTELDIDININDKIILDGGRLTTVLSYTRKPVRMKRRGSIVYEYRLVLK